MAEGDIKQIPLNSSVNALLNQVEGGICAMFLKFGISQEQGMSVLVSLLTKVLQDNVYAEDYEPEVDRIAEMIKKNIECRPQNMKFRKEENAEKHQQGQSAADPLSETARGETGVQPGLKVLPQDGESDTGREGDVPLPEEPKPDDLAAGN